MMLRIPLIPSRPSHPVAIAALGFKMAGVSMIVAGQVLDKTAESLAHAAFHLDQADFVNDVTDDIAAL